MRPALLNSAGNSQIGCQGRLAARTGLQRADRRQALQSRQIGSRLFVHRLFMCRRFVGRRFVGRLGIYPWRAGKRYAQQRYNSGGMV